MVKQAQRMAGRKVAFYGHGVAWLTTSLLVFFVAGSFVGTLVAMAWAIGLACHGYFAVAAPKLRQRWIKQELNGRVATTVADERRQLESKHARSMGELSASIAHEIRNPITAAKSLVQQMGEDPNCDENVEYARIALEELDRVEHSISHLLRFAREEPVRLETIDVAGVVDSALDTFRDRLAESGVQVDRDIDVNGQTRADPDKIRRVVINLVGNALDAVQNADVSAPVVSVSAGQNLADTELWLRVRDNGPGIEPERLAQVFSPFHTSKADGTGLGLAITKKIVEGHGGTIEATSEPGSGTEFVVMLPKNSVEAHA